MNEAFEDAFKHSRALIDIMPDFAERLKVAGRGARELANELAGLRDTEREIGSGSGHGGRGDFINGTGGGGGGRGTGGSRSAPIGVTLNEAPVAVNVYGANLTQQQVTSAVIDALEVNSHDSLRRMQRALRIA